MSLVNDIKAIQRHCGAEPDGKFGPKTAAAVLRELRSQVATYTMDGTSAEAQTVEVIDARTAQVIHTLDPKAQDIFLQFAHLAKATAATLGYDYIAISGHRSWEKQDELYAQPHDGKDNDGDGRIDEADEKVTNAQGGESNHNFGIAVDFGVFCGGFYMDGGDAIHAATAKHVHEACAVHARALGLEWGGDWKGFKDYPHYEMRTGLTTAQKRNVYQQRGSVL
jgi:peptidoglycan L-alanyl-D-glutamate endopeptidase CwlK